MKSIKKIVSLLMALLLVMSITGCVLNEEKDAKAVVATVGGKDYLKSDFNDFYTFYLFRQEAYGYPITGTEQQMADNKLSMFEEYVMRLVMKEECTAAGVDVSASTIESSVAELMEQLNAKEDKDAILKKYGYTEADIQGIATEMITLLDYVSPFLTNNLDNSFGSKIAATVEGTEIPMSTFYYYTLVNYISSTQGDPFDPQNYYPTVYKYIVAGQKSIEYVTDQGLTIPEETKEEMKNTLAMLDLYGLSDYAKNTFFLTDDQINEAVEFTVNALSAQDVILEKFGDDADFTEEELKAYYDASASSYDKSYVKAYHILTEDKDFAQTMYDETGKTADGFMAVYEKYGKDEKVKEATDLGDFNRGEMVDEFEECAFGLKAGEVGICETQFGTHIVYVYESNITDTSYEDVKDQVLEDYRADHIEYFGQSHLNECIEGYKDTEGEYRIIPSDLLKEYLYGKYDVKVDTKAAGR